MPLGRAGAPQDFRKTTTSRTRVRQIAHGIGPPAAIRRIRVPCRSERDFVYVWADGVHPKIRLGQAHSCVWVLLGAGGDPPNPASTGPPGTPPGQQRSHKTLAGFRPGKR